MSWKDFGRDLYHEADRDHLLDFAGSVAFSAFLAVFPFLLFAVALASLVIDPTTLTTLIDQIRRVAPPGVADLLADRLRALTTGTPPAVLTVGGLGALWAASSAIAALTTALDSAYDVEETRPFWKTRGMALLITLAGSIFVVAATAIAVAAPAVAHHLGGPVGTLVLWLRWPVAALIMAFVLACLYYFLPDVEQSFRFITPGSLVAVVLWVLASLGFSLYVGHVAGYEVVYGALGSVIVLMLWMWISALAVLLGAEINAVLEHRAPEGKRTLAETGPDVPKSAKS